MRMLQEVAWALTYAHDNGIVHRDVKPDNIMIERASGRALVTDFGIARLVDTADSTPRGEVVGTARYMSPEQASGDEVDARSDLYSLGATAFFGLTGHAPFEAPNVSALLAKHVAEPAPPMASVREDLPPKLAALVDRCLAKDSEARFQTGNEIAEAIGELRGRELRAPPLVRNFLRNAQVTTAVFITAALVGQGSSNPGIVDLLLIVLLVQLLSVARRLLRDGYAFGDIRAALLAEASAQEEEADAAGQRKFMRRLNGFWHRIWAGRFGRFFFKVAGLGVRSRRRPAVPSAEATETILGRAAVELYESLPGDVRSRLPGARKVIHCLENDAEELRRVGGADGTLVTAVTALENVRVELLRLQAGEGSVNDLTSILAQAREIGDRIDAELEARSAAQ